MSWSDQGDKAMGAIFVVCVETAVRLPVVLEGRCRCRSLSKNSGNFGLKQFFHEGVL